MDREFPLVEMKINLSDPKQNVYTLGSAAKTFTSSTTGSTASIQKQIETLPTKRNILKQAADNAAAMLNNAGKDGHVIFSPSLADPKELYITDAGNLAEAVRLWRWNEAGLGFSEDGGKTYKTAITMDGWINGQALAAGSVYAEQIDAEYTQEQEKKWRDELENEYWTSGEVTTQIKNSADNVLLSAEQKMTSKLGSYYTKSEIDVTVNGINSTVSKKVGNNEIISKINQSAESVKISASKVNIDASTFRVQATKLSWKSTYSEMSESGILKCSNAELKGTLRAGSTNGYWIELSGSGRLTGGYGSSQYGYIDYSGSFRNISTGATSHGIQIQGGGLRISTNRISVAATSNVNTTATYGGTGDQDFIYKIDDLGNGRIQWWTTTLSFINGLMCTDI